eukprot:Filipodium_phascolosomae@DN2712_c0_g1_i1.p1
MLVPIPPDRHVMGGSKAQLIPIDDGVIMPDVLDVAEIEWAWLNLPQLEEPLDQLTCDYVLELQPDEDALAYQRRMRANFASYHSDIADRHSARFELTPDRAGSLS